MMQNIPQKDTVSVCICTYKRPKLLANAIDSILSQITNNEFLFEVVISDNDIIRSAEGIVKKFQKNTNLKIIYDCEPEQNIALARNRAVKNTSGNLIAFIDDDEIPVKDWLLKLYRTWKSKGADGVLGPVLPSYPEEAPKWLSKCRLFDRRRFKTGIELTNPRDTRTGNVLLSLSSLSKENVWFDPLFGKTGGEDVNFFNQQILNGKKFVWCDEAIAYETIPPERWKSNFYLKRYFRSGAVHGQKYKTNFIKRFFMISKSFLAIFIWALIFPFSIPFGKHFWFRPVLKISYFLGYILSVFGFSLFTERD